MLFFPIVFFLYWVPLSHKEKYQNIVLLIASFIFYGWWDWRFLLLININIFIDYYIGSKLQTETINIKRKIYLITSIVINIGILFYFKYFNFFIASFINVTCLLGINVHIRTLNIILPIAISYYTLQTLGYTIDVYLRKTKPTSDYITFLTYISFFPKLLAGPIERASNCLAQFSTKRVFIYADAVDGARQILWGLFKKITIADACAEGINAVFTTPSIYGSSTLAFIAILFSIQIYADFSGYSEIAVGLARLLGIKIIQNFRYPYFSKNIAEFWRRWHISLSTWLRDYIFLPFTYSLMRMFKRERYFNIKTDKIVNIISTIFTFTLCGVWHGASSNYILWGIIHGTMVAAQVFKKKIIRKDKYIDLKTIVFEQLKIASTFLLITVAWIIFRADGLNKVRLFIKGMISKHIFSMPDISLLPKETMVMIFIMFMFEIYHHKRQHGLDFNDIKTPKTIKYIIYIVLISFIVLSFRQGQQYIYFKY